MPSPRSSLVVPVPLTTLPREAPLHRGFLAATLLLAVTGCGLSSEDVDALRDAARPYLDGSATSVAPPASLPTPVQAETLLAGLTRGERNTASLPRYERTAFGTPWRDVDGNGCNQRDDVLLRDAVPGSVRVGTQGACDHDVLGGTWLDPYTGATLTFTDLKDRAQAQALQIDHVVPLAEAWRSGAWAWPENRREQFANDVDGLLALDGPTNASKGDDDPAAWRPRHPHQCTYAVRWIAVKDDWELAVDPSERRALASMLDTCPTP